MNGTETREQELLRIEIQITDAQELTAENGTVKMIAFQGACSCPLFQGKILPGGIDTQRLDHMGYGTLSARYMLEGRDETGKICRLFIENNAALQPNGEIITRPEIRTDSSALRWLETAELTGSVQVENEQLTILIYQEERPSAQGVIEESMDVTGPAGVIRGRLFRPATTEAVPAIIFSHGYNGTGDDFTEDCRYFASRGYMAYAFDFPGGSVHSRSDGETTQMTIFTEKEALLSVYHAVEALPGVKTGQITLLGGSQGGLVTALAAAELKERVPQVVLYFPALNIPDDWRKRFPLEKPIPETFEFWEMTLGREFFASIRSFDPMTVIGGYEGRVLIVYGADDPIVPLGHMLQAQQQYRQAELLILPGEAHGFSPRAAEKVRKYVLSWLQEA